MSGNENFTVDTFNLNGFYRGVVVDNLDPLQLGRVKIRVFGVFKDSIPNEYLPWAIRAQAVGSGAGSGYGNFQVPEIDSYVFLFFEKGDVYQPVYFAEAPDGVHGLPSERTINYPYRKITKTKSGIVIIIDDSSKEIYINHPSGSYLKIDSAGNIEISGTTIHLNP